MTGGDTVTCVFTEIMKNIDTGIIILDLEKEEVFFRNIHAVKIFQHVDAASSYEDYYKLLRNEIEELKQPGVTRSTRTKKHSGHRILGYSVYRLAQNWKYVFVFIRDITDQHRLEAIDEASEIMNNIGYLFSGIRHEIGNPLNSIKTALTVVQNNIHKYSPEEFEVYFKRIFGEVAKIEILLKSLKNFNMFEKPEMKTVDLAQFFEDLFQLIGVDLKSKDIGIIVNFPENARVVSVDPRALQHVMMNLIANATDAMEGKEGATLVIETFADDTVVQLYVKDNGCGMTPELLQNVFKPFYTTKIHGTGLGLAISKKMMTQMNCGIDILSSHGEGTIVTLTLPVSARESQELRPGNLAP